MMQDLTNYFYLLTVSLSYVFILELETLISTFFLNFFGFFIFSKDKDLFYNNKISSKKLDFSFNLHNKVNVDQD
jgi:hypothetical protein